jgi:phosphate transport system substrate-binding protein
MERVMGTLAEQFHLEHPGVTVTVEGGGSGAGVAAAAGGSADIGLSSRRLREEEAGLRETVVALDGIVVVVQADNPVTDLTVEQIAAIYRGDVQSWAEVGGESAPIARVGRESGSGTREGFETATGTTGDCLLDQELISSGAVIEAVRSNPQAIGYAALSAAEGQSGIRILTVDGVACTEETLRSGSYAIQRPFVLVTGQDLTPQAQAFLDFAVSSEAAPLIRAAGAVPTAS